MRIHLARFVSSNTDLKGLPKGNLPEYAFIGRSNVGKSSLINMICNQKKLAKTSSTPGKTRLINHFIVNEEWYLVDLPGYGYARLSKVTKEKISKFVSNYLLDRGQLGCVFVLIDSRLEPQHIDLEFINWLGNNHIPFVIAFTKCDKISIQQAQRNIALFKKAMYENWEEIPDCFMTSSEDRAGRDEILNFIEVTNSRFKNN